MVYSESRNRHSKQLVITLEKSSVSISVYLWFKSPYPVNPITTIQYDLPEASNVRLVIFDLLGREVITLIQDRQEAGYQSIIWNGRDRLGREVATGIYIYQLIAGDPSSGSGRTFVSTKKLVLIK